MIARRFLIALVMIAAAAHAHAGEFDRVVAALQRDSALEREWIPFFGVARTFIRAIAPNGVHDVQLAVYNGPGRGDWNELVRTAMQSAGPQFRPMVSARERSGESTLVLARAQGRLLEMIILTRDGDETVLLRVLADPKQAQSIVLDHDFR